jgi:hypothetical protein
MRKIPMTIAAASIVVAAIAAPTSAEARWWGGWRGAGIAAGVIGGAVIASRAYGYGGYYGGYGGYGAYGGYGGYGSYGNDCAAYRYGDYGYSDYVLPPWRCTSYSYGHAPAIYGYAPAYSGYGSGYYAPRRYIGYGGYRAYGGYRGYGGRHASLYGPRRALVGRYDGRRFR